MVWGVKPGSGDLLMADTDTVAAGIGSFHNATVGSQLGFNVASGSVLDVASARVGNLDVSSNLVYQQGSGVQFTVNSLIIPEPIVSSAATVGSSAALPATPHGYLTLSISGENVKVPYFNE